LPHREPSTARRTPPAAWRAGGFARVGALDHPCANRVQHDEARQFLEIRFLLHDDRLLPTLEDVPAVSVNLVEPLGIDAFELPHPIGQIRVRRLQEQVVVVGDDTVCVAPPIEALAHISEHLQEQLPVAVKAEDVPTTVTARRDVLQGDRKLKSEGARHAQSQLPWAKGKTLRAL
jgi:hypothetical protein